MGKFIDLTGMIYCGLTVISLNEEVSKQKKRKCWNCVCDCGNECVVDGGNLKSGRQKTCGHCNDVHIGDKYNMLTVLERTTNNKRNQAMWKCVCDCGNVSVVSSYNLKNGKIKSCGCLRNEKSRDRMKELNEKQWQDEEYRQMKSERTREQFFNPDLTDEYREKDRKLQQGYREWQYKVKEQADYTCDCCGKRGGNLVSHHLDSYNWCKERRLDVENGVCLCESCHKEFHHIYGYGDNTKEQYEEFKRLD